MRRKFMMVFAVAGVFLATSCGSGEGTTTVTVVAGTDEVAETATTVDTGSEAEAEEPVTSSDARMLFVNPLPQVPIWREIGDCLAEGAEQRGVEMTESGPSGQALDPVAMINQIQQGIANDFDAIITFPASEGFAPVLQDAQAADILTATILGTGTADSGADLNFANDWELIGQQYIDALDAIDGDKVIGLIAVADAGQGKDWMDGIRAAVEGRDDITIAGEVYTGDDSSKALDQTTALLTANPDVNVVATHMGTVTQGAVAAIESNDKLGEVYLLGAGIDNGGAEALDSGAAIAMQMTNICESSRAGIDQIVDRLEGITTATSDEPEEILGSADAVTMATQDTYPALIEQGWR